jgi:hypothetical protein
MSAADGAFALEFGEIRESGVALDNKHGSRLKASNDQSQGQDDN